MANKDLFKQAIAEAKSVREAAIANAKEALEETLTPHLKDMLAAKLQEMDDSSVGEEVVNEVEEEVEEGMDKDKKDEAIEEDFTEAAEEMDADDADDDSGESDEEAEEEVEVKDMEVDDLKDLIRDIIAQEMGADAEGEEMPTDELPSDDMVGADDEEIDLDELLKEIAEMDDEHKNEAMSHDDDHKDEAMETEKKYEAMHSDDHKDEAMDSDDHKDEAMINEVDPLTVGAGVAAIFGASVGLDKLMSKLEAGDFGPQGEKLAAGLRKHGKAAANRYNEGEMEVSNETDMGEVSTHTRTPENNDLLKAMAFIGKQAKKAGKSVADFVKGIEMGKMSDAMKEIELEEASELEEAMTTINEMKGKLQEVNLLNAKLLYVNKVFKANNLTESQKVNVIAAFDKAETVKEVKLVFETVADNVVSRTTKSTIKEAKFGMASKATGITASKPEVITEVSDTVRRMQKLAGIIK
jgi:hypothetical protein